MSSIQYEGISYDLTTLHTKQLLNLFRNIKANSICSCCGEWVYGDYSMEVSEIKLELDKREHVPNKIEAKAIRKQKALQRRNKKNKKYVNRK